jgi:hypothetical protein
MKKTILTAALLLAAAPSWAQVFEPVSVKQATPNATKHVILLQASQFKWDEPGFHGKTGPLVAADFSLGDSFTLGGWFADDKEAFHIANFSDEADVKWSEGHLTWVAKRSTSSAVGLTAGVLQAHISGDGASMDARWTEVGLTGSIGLNGSGKAPLTLGLNGGALIGQKSDEIEAFDGYTYGASLSYQASKAISVDAAFWQMHLKDSDVDITRFNAGVGFHF